MKILIIGDVVGNCGTSFLRQNLSDFARANSVDMIIANGENASKGNGLDLASAELLFVSGVDVITSGNHIIYNSKVEMKNTVSNYIFQITSLFLLV